MMLEVLTGGASASPQCHTGGDGRRALIGGGSTRTDDRDVEPMREAPDEPDVMSLTVCLCVAEGHAGRIQTC